MGEMGKPERETQLQIEIRGVDNALNSLESSIEELYDSIRPVIRAECEEIPNKKTEVEPVLVTRADQIRCFNLRILDLERRIRDYIDRLEA